MQIFFCGEFTLSFKTNRQVLATFRLNERENERFHCIYLLGLLQYSIQLVPIGGQNCSSSIFFTWSNHQCNSDICPPLACTVSLTLFSDSAIHVKCLSETFSLRTDLFLQHNPAIYNRKAPTECFSVDEVEYFGAFRGIFSPIWSKSSV